MLPYVHALRPLAVLLAAFLLVEGLGLDRAIAHSLFYDPASARWLGGGSWWARDLLHDTGRWVVRGVAAGALLVWTASFAAPQWRGWRGSAGFVVVAIALPVMLIGILKAMTNVDCPWDLAEFGGARPYVGLFNDRPNYLPAARCFPGAHSSSGFALLCFYFVWRDRRPRLARAALWGGGIMGVLFAFGQEARGAHFLSHDLASVVLVWFLQWMLYAGMLHQAGSRLQQDSRQRVRHHAGGQATQDVPGPA